MRVSAENPDEGRYVSSMFVIAGLIEFSGGFFCKIHICSHIFVPDAIGQHGKKHAKVAAGVMLQIANQVAVIVPLVLRFDGFDLPVRARTQDVDQGVCI